MSWVEWILSHALLRIVEANLTGLDQFWLDQGAGLLFTLLQSVSANPAFARSVAGEGGITVLASLANSTNRFVAEEAA
ncbi:hypothetical protein Hanom_Chr04g00281641 [Helianthus anomalus]